MTLKIGNVNRLPIVREKEIGVYLAYEDGDILMPRKWVPPEATRGTELDVFVYTDSEDRLIATTQRPYAVVGEFAALQVKDVTSIGAFLDWGLEKDLFVPFKQQAKRMVADRTYVVRVCLDHITGRVIGTSKLRGFLSKNTQHLRRGQEVNVLICDTTDIGYMAIADDRYEGMLYHNQVFRPLNIGERCEGYIRQIRPDHKLDLSLQPRGYEALRKTEPQIIETLEKAGGFIPCTDKSSPEQIKETFGMSKKAFKKLVGALYKEGRIELEPDGIRLK